ncbi:MAG: WD40 repeat domain-containing protein, partial [Planktothrix sp.]|uniref:WD40 repeat domain-containing protein n=1 Tax=Planktothrix sp. TaxID=3088171 RepID=UPI0038D3A70B
MTQKQLLRTLEGHSDWIQNVVISSDDQSLVTGSRDGILKIWQKDPDTPAKTEKFNIPLGYIIVWIISAILAKFTAGTTLTIPFLTQAFFFGNSNNQSKFQFLVNTLKCVKTITGKFQTITNFDITPNSNIQVIGTNNGSIYIQSPNQYPNQSRKITGHAGFIGSLAVSSNGKLFVSGSQDWIKLWDLQTGEILNVLEGESPKLKSLQINPDYRELYCGQSEQFNVKGFDQYNQPFSLGQVTWTAQGGTIKNGRFTAGNISGSNFKVQAQVNSVSCQVLITILEKPKLTSLTINPSTTTLYCGQSQQFKVEGFDQYNQPISIGKVTWTADNIKLPNNGIFVAGYFETTVIITAKVETISQSVQVE